MMHELVAGRVRPYRIPSNAGRHIENKSGQPCGSTDFNSLRLCHLLFLSQQQMRKRRQ